MAEADPNPETPKAGGEPFSVALPFVSFRFFSPFLAVVSENAGNMWCCIFGGFADFSMIFI
jgi:hypothetical protein